MSRLDMLENTHAHQLTNEELRELLTLRMQQQYDDDMEVVEIIIERK